jgi:hypothetical protein
LRSRFLYFTSVSLLLGRASQADTVALLTANQARPSRASVPVHIEVFSVVTARSAVAEDFDLNLHRRENLKSCAYTSISRTLLGAKFVLLQQKAKGKR